MPEELLEEELTTEQIAYYEDRIQFAKDLMKLANENKTFQRLVKEYTEDYALTQLQNAHSFDGNSAVRFVEKFKARSHFLSFIQETIEDGRKASLDLEDGNKEQF